MPWSRDQPTDPKYRSKAHRDYLASLKRRLTREGYLECTATVCEYGDRTITNPNGSHPDGLTAGHNNDGVNYDGPQHRLCNVRDGARRGRARQGNALTSSRFAL